MTGSEAKREQGDSAQSSGTPSASGKGVNASVRSKASPRVLRGLWLALGFISLGLGFAGIVLPLLPTTPFILLAAIAFARSSQRWHDWLMQHRIFGPLIEDWQRYGAIGRTAKRLAILSLGAVFAVSLLLRVPMQVLAIQGVVLLACAVFILSRPTPPR